MSEARSLHTELVGDGRYRLVVPSDVTRIGEAVEAIAFCCFGADAGSPRTRFRLCTVVAEAVANAMLYGNGGDPERVVIVDIELHDTSLSISVTDEGPGFDPDAVPTPIDAGLREATRGRGLYMIRGLTERVVFNERGNSICMTLPRG